MKNPKNSQALLAMILGMGHRERFLLKATQGVDKKYGKPCFVEIYNADLKDTIKTNVSITLVDKEGDKIIGIDGNFANKPVIFNKLKSLFDQSYADKHFPSVNPLHIPSEYVDQFGHSDLELESETEPVSETPAPIEAETTTEPVSETPAPIEAETTTEPVSETPAESVAEIPAVEEIAQVVAETVAEIPGKKETKKSGKTAKTKAEKVD